MLNISKIYCSQDSDSDELRYRRVGQGKPIAVFNITARCNLRCLHCYTGSTCSVADDELSTDHARYAISQFADYGCPVVLLSGGEPFMREDFFDLAAHARKSNLRTVVSTNGTLINYDRAQALAQLGISYVGVSLDGPEKQHDHFRDSKGAFASALRGIENCNKARVKTGLRFTMTAENIAFVPDLFEIAKSTGVRRICFYHLVRTGRGAALKSQCPTKVQTRRTLETIIALTDQYVRAGLIDEVLTVGNHADAPYLLLQMKKNCRPGFDKARQLLLANAGNRSGQGICSVNWDGSVYADQFWRNYSLGNIRTNSFRLIWENPLDPVLRILRNKDEFADPRCKNCRWFPLCRGNYRFLGPDPAPPNWTLEPQCYLTDEEIGIGD